MFLSRDRPRIFRDRREAGQALAARLAGDELDGELLVLGLPRGGLPVAHEIAVALNAALDVLVVRKLGAPFNPELALGAIALGGVVVYDDVLLGRLGLDEAALEPTRERETRELKRREQAYRGDKPPPELENKTVILVDDGIATGATMQAAVRAARLLRPRKIVVAAPTSSVEALRRLRNVADEVVVLSSPEPYMAVGAWYQRFNQVSDQEVIDLLSRDMASDTNDSTRTEGSPV